MSSPASRNPFLEFDRLPDFASIRAEHIKPAVEQVLTDNRAVLQLLENDDAAPDWHNMMDVLDDLDDRLSKVWSTASHLNGVLNTPAIREAYNSCQPLITEYYSALGQNEKLYRRIEVLNQRAGELGLDGSQRRIIRDMLLDFRLAGVSLPETDKKRFTEIQTRLSELSNRFGNNVLDATMAWSKHIADRAALAGVPEMTLSAAAEAAARKEQSGYLLTLDFPCYYAVMTYADDATLREEMYRAYATRASEFADKNLDNKQNIRDILQLREEMAKLLGYPDYASVSVARKMARSVDRVNNFLDDLISYSRPAAQREYQELCEFAAQHSGVATLNAWDVSYYSEKLRKAEYDVSQEELRAYFPIDKVRTGLFAIVETLYDVQIERDNSVSVWAADVEFYNICRHGEVIARFYFDLFTRDGKRGGAWMADCRSRRLLTSQGAAVSQQIPVAYLICNFAPPTANDPALLTHNDVTTLFHEFGHGLHHMLTRENYLRSSGISGVEWDAVELPSQLMENWCWDPRSIGMISGHYQSGEPLPQALLDKMLAAKNFQAGMKSVRQLEFAHFDFALHQAACTEDTDFVSAILQQTRTKTAVYPVPDYNRFQNSFSHIFAGGYAAGYYSYKWAEVLSADVFSRFTEAGVLNSEVGQAFLDKILSKGGGADALDLFKNFMGREPDIAALLRQDGLQRH
jgi:oligopeptidase A